MIDDNQRDFFITVPNDMRATQPVGFWEGVGATAAYINMPMFESIEETRLFGDRLRKDGFNPMDRLSERQRPYYKEFLRAKDDEHFDFIASRLDRELLRKQKMSDAGVGAQIVGSTLDPLFFTAFVPGLNAIGLGRTVLSSGARFAAAGGAFGVASEARRAPFAVADDPFETEMNIASAAVISGFFGAGAKTIPGLLPAAKSTANKFNKLLRGEDAPHLFDEAGNAQLMVNGDEVYSAKIHNPFGSFIQRMLNDDKIPQSIKEIGLKMTYNSSVPTKGTATTVMPQSVFQRSAVYEGDSYRLIASLEDLHKQQAQGTNQMRVLGASTSDFNPFNKSFDEWLDDTITRYLDLNNPNPAVRRSAKEGLSDQQIQAHSKLGEFFNAFDEDARFVGLLKDDAKIKSAITELEDGISSKASRLDELETKIKSQAGGGMTAKQKKLMDELNDEIASARAKIVDLEDALNQPTRKSFKFPIYYNKERLLKDEQYAKEFVEDFTEHYKTQGVSDPAASAKNTLDTILEVDAEELVDLRATKSGPSKHMRHRKTNVDEWRANKYMVKNADVIHSYAERMGKRIEFARAFDGKTFDDVLSEIETTLRKQKFNDKRIAEIKSGFILEHDRLMGALLRNPDRMDNQLSKFSRSYAGWTLLGFAGASAVTDVGSVVMAHGLKDTYRAGIAGIFDRSTGKLFKNAQQGGAALDMIRNVTQRKLLGDSMKRVQPNALERTQEIGNRFMYTANLLGPVTTIFKFTDQLLVSDKFFKMSNDLMKNKISPRDLEYLNRYGIDKDLAKYITEMPFEKADNSNFMLANTDDWPAATAAERNMKRRFQAAMTAHSDNSVIMGQLFDRPVIMDGVTYIKDNAVTAGLRKQFPNLFAIDTRASTAGQKMIRLESGTMTIPFTFMNFVFGANNKILGVIRDPARKYRLQGMVSLLALSYLSFEIKDPWWWNNEPDNQDVLARLIDHSGMLGIYGDLGYMALGMIGNMADNPDEFFIKPKFVSPNEEDRLVDALVSPFGAPVDIGVGVARAAKDFINGDTGEGVEELRRNAPFLGLPIIRDDVKELTRDFARGR